VLRELAMPPITRVTNVNAVLFEGQEPQERTGCAAEVQDD